MILSINGVIAETDSTSTSNTGVLTFVSGTPTIMGGTADFGTIAVIPDSPPEVPAAPDAQDVVDALVTLGFITQASGE